MTLSLPLTAATESAETARDDWANLADRLGASPFLRPEWVLTWGAAFEERIITRSVRDASGRLCAILPILSRRGEIRAPTNWHTPEFGWLAASDRAADHLLESFFDDRPRRVSIAFLSPEEAERARAAFERNGSRVLSRTLQHSPYIQLGGDFLTYEASLSRKLRSDLRRRQRLLEKEGSVEFEVTSGEDLDAKLAEGWAVEQSGWKGSRGTAIESDPRTRQFYREIAHWGVKSGILRLAFLRLDGRPLAFDLCFETRSRHYLIKTGYDPAARSRAVGKLLRRAMISRAFDRGLETYEFLGTDAPWKREWTEETRPRELVQGFRRSPLGLIDFSVVRHGRPLARRVRGWARTVGQSAGRERTGTSAEVARARAEEGTTTKPRREP